MGGIPSCDKSYKSGTLRPPNNCGFYSHYFVQNNFPYVKTQTSEMQMAIKTNCESIFKVFKNVTHNYKGKGVFSFVVYFVLNCKTVYTLSGVYIAIVWPNPAQMDDPLRKIKLYLISIIQIEWQSYLEKKTYPHF